MILYYRSIDLIYICTGKILEGKHSEYVNVVKQNYDLPQSY